MQNDLLNGLNNIDIPVPCSIAGQMESGFSNTEYRWSKVNKSLYVYLSTIEENGNFPRSQPLAHVRQTRNGKFEAIRAGIDPYIMNIPEGSLETVKTLLEQQIYYEVQLAKQLKKITLHKH